MSHLWAFNSLLTSAHYPLNTKFYLIFPHCLGWWNGVYNCKISIRRWGEQASWGTQSEPNMNLLNQKENFNLTRCISVKTGSNHCTEWGEIENKNSNQEAAGDAIEEKMRPRFVTQTEHALTDHGQCRQNSSLELQIYQCHISHLLRVTSLSLTSDQVLKWKMHVFIMSWKGTTYDGTCVIKSWFFYFSFKLF